MSIRPWSVPAALLGFLLVTGVPAAAVEVKIICTNRKTDYQIGLAKNDSGQGGLSFKDKDGDTVALTRPGALESIIKGGTTVLKLEIPEGDAFRRMVAVRANGEATGFFYIQAKGPHLKIDLSKDSAPWFKSAKISGNTITLDK